MRQKISNDKKIAIRKAISLLIIAVGLPIISGCSASGYLIGSVIDSINDHGSDIPRYYVHQFEPGQNIRVVKTDSTVIEGTFSTIIAADDSAYAERYRSAQNEADDVSILPEYMDEVSIKTATGEEISGKLSGYDIRFPEANQRIQAADDWPESEYEVLNLMPLPESDPKRVLLKDIDTIAYDTITATAGIFRGASRSNTLPLRSSIVMKTEHAVATIPFDKTARTGTFSKTKIRWALFGIGLVTDIVIAVVAIAMADFNPGPFVQ